MKPSERVPQLRNLSHGLAFARTGLEVSGDAIARPGALRFFVAFAGPLAGFAAVAVAGTALASKTPELRFHVGVGAAVVGCTALAAMIVSSLAGSIAFALHLGAAATVIALAMLCADPVVALVGTAVLAIGFLVAVHRRAVQEIALVVPAIAIPIVAGFLHPNVDLAIAGIAMLGLSAATLLAGRIQAAAVLLLVPLVLFHGGSDQGGPWAALAVVGVFMSLLFQVTAHAGLHSSVSRFAVEGMFLLYIVDAGSLITGDEQSATLFAAGVSAVSAGVHSVLRNEMAAERFACTALLLTFAVFDGDSAPRLPSYLAVVAIGGMLQLVAIKARCAFAYRVALALVVLGATYPVAILFNFTGDKESTANSGGAILLGLASGAVLLLLAVESLGGARPPGGGVSSRSDPPCRFGRHIARLPPRSETFRWSVPSWPLHAVRTGLCGIWCAASNRSACRS